MRAVLASCVAGVGESGVVREALAVRARPAVARVAGHGERRGGRVGREGRVGRGRGGRSARRPVHAACVHHQLVTAAGEQYFIHATC